MFRPRKLDRVHPKELLECAFDIVVPVTSSLLPDAETIYTISEVIQEFSALQVPGISSCYVKFFKMLLLIMWEVCGFMLVVLILLEGSKDVFTDP